MADRPPLPPFTGETAALEAAAEGAWMREPDPDADPDVTELGR